MYSCVGSAWHEWRRRLRVEEAVRGPEPPAHHYERRRRDQCTARLLRQTSSAASGPAARVLQQLRRRSLERVPLVQSGIREWLASSGPAARRQWGRCHAGCRRFCRLAQLPDSSCQMS